jgi:hypothetical protein
MRESIKMARSDGFLSKFQKHHKTNNLLLRWFANLCEIPAHYFLNKFLHYSDHDDYGLVSRFHARISYWFYKPYLRWGTVYRFVTDSESIDT